MDTDVKLQLAGATLPCPKHPWPLPSRSMEARIAVQCNCKEGRIPVFPKEVRVACGCPKSIDKRKNWVSPCWTGRGSACPGWTPNGDSLAWDKACSLIYVDDDARQNKEQAPVRGYTILIIIQGQQGRVDAREDGIKNLEEAKFLALLRAVEAMPGVELGRSFVALTTSPDTPYGPASVVLAETERSI